MANLQSSGQSQPLPIISAQQIANQPQWTGTLSSEDPLDKEYRLKREADEARHKRWRSTILFLVTLAGIVFVFYFCVRIVSDARSAPDDKKWATALMTSIVTGGIGFVTGKDIA